jgi:hypothetical protein
MNIEESQRRFMDSCEPGRIIEIAQLPPSRRDWLETIAILAAGFVAGALIF